MTDRPTPIELLKLTEGYFRDKGVDNPRLDAEVLLAHVLDTERIGLYLQFDKPLDDGEVDAYRALVRRRGAGEPVSYLVGHREFWSMRFAVGPGVLTPRPETERLVECALEKMGETGRFLDLGVGSGAIAVALLTDKPGWTGVGIDREPAAVETAAKNGKALGVGGRLEVLQGDLFAPVAGQTFELIVSNPPYIPTGDIAGLVREVADHEPRVALDGGDDGLDPTRRIVAEAPGHLTPSGWLLMEFGVGQGEAVRTILEEAPGLDVVQIIDDFAGIPRVARAQRAD